MCRGGFNCLEDVVYKVRKIGTTLSGPCIYSTVLYGATTKCQFTLFTKEAEFVPVYLGSQLVK